MSILEFDERSPWVQFDFLDEIAIKNMLTGIIDDENRLKEIYELYHKFHSMFKDLDSNPIITLAALIPIVTTNVTMFTEAEAMYEAFAKRIWEIVEQVLKMKNLEETKPIEDIEVIDGDSSESR